MGDTRRFIIAIDGGGTKTDCIVGDTAGKVLAFRNAGPVRADVFATGFRERCEADWKNLADITSSILKDAGLPSERLNLLVLALNGIDLPGDEDSQPDGPQEFRYVCNDCSEEFDTPKANKLCPKCLTDKITDRRPE